MNKINIHCNKFELFFFKVKVKVKVNQKKMADNTNLNILLIHFDLIPNVVQYLNQVDLYRLTLTCKHYNNNNIIKDCLSKIKSFLFAKATVKKVNNFKTLVGSLFVLFSYSEPHNSYQYVTNNLIIFIKRLLDNNITIGSVVHVGNNSYIFKPNPATLLDNYYFKIKNDKNHDLCYNIYKLVTKIENNKTYYGFIEVQVNPNIHSPHYFNIQNNLLLYKINLFNPKNYKVCNDIGDNNYTFKESFSKNNVHYKVYEFNIKNCMSKVVYFIYYINFVSYKYELNEYYVELYNTIADRPAIASYMLKKNNRFCMYCICDSEIINLFI